MTTRALPLITLFLLACQGDPVPEIPMAKVTLGVIMHAQGDDPVAQDAWRIARGAKTYEITTFAIILSDLEVHACAPTVSWNLPGVSLAHAHVPDSATRLGTPYVLDMLAAPGRARVLGEIAPPRGDYCSMYAVVTPADEDVVSLSALDARALEGKSMVLSGRVREGDDGAWRPFEWSETARRAVRIELGKKALGAKGGFWLLDRARSASIFSTDAELGTPAATRAIFDAALATLALHDPSQTSQGTKKP